MSLKLNIASTYFSQIYNGFIGIIVMPIFLLNMGSEAYGLIAIFTLVQAWFALLDAGISQSVSRQTARYYAGTLTSQDYCNLYNGLHVAFLFICSFVLVLLLTNIDGLARSWLNVKKINNEDISYILGIIFVCVFMRCIGGLYRGVINGAEKIVWLSFFNIALATLRFVLVIPYLYLYDFQILKYFEYQFFIALFEYIILFWKKNNLIPKNKINIKQSLIEVRKNKAFIINIGIASTIWLLISQFDKLLLSKYVSLSDYGYYSMAVMLASIILLCSSPIGNAILPRLTNLISREKKEEAISIYMQLTKFVCIIITMVGFIIILNINQVLLTWIGDLSSKKYIEDTIIFYILGNIFLVLSNFPYYLQYAVGDLKYHMRGNLILASIMIPSMFLAVLNYGVNGAGLVWLIINFIWFLVWPYFIHKIFFQKIYNTWMLSIVVTGFYILFLNLGLSLIGQEVLNGNYSRMANFIYLIILGLINLLVVVIFSKKIREFILIKFRVLKS